MWIIFVDGPSPILEVWQNGKKAHQRYNELKRKRKHYIRIFIAKVQRSEGGENEWQEQQT